MNRAVGVVFSEAEIPGGWYQWIPAEMVEDELRSTSDWFFEQAMCALRDGGKAVWLWVQ